MTSSIMDIGSPFDEIAALQHQNPLPNVLYDTVLTHQKLQYRQLCEHYVWHLTVVVDFDNG